MNRSSPETEPASSSMPGIPMLFMGQEFLEDKQWTDDVVAHHDLLLYWAGLEQGDKQMLDHIRFTRELLDLRRQTPGLRGQGFRVMHAHDQNRVLAFHRRVEGEGHDAIVVLHLAPSTGSAIASASPAAERGAAY